MRTKQKTKLRGGLVKGLYVFIQVLSALTPLPLPSLETALFEDVSTISSFFVYLEHTSVSKNLVFAQFEQENIFAIAHFLFLQILYITTNQVSFFPLQVLMKAIYVKCIDSLQNNKYFFIFDVKSLFSKIIFFLVGIEFKMGKINQD